MILLQILSLIILLIYLFYELNFVPCQAHIDSDQSCIYEICTPIIIHIFSNGLPKMGFYIFIPANYSTGEGPNTKREVVMVLPLLIQLSFHQQVVNSFIENPCSEPIL